MSSFFATPESTGRTGPALAPHIGGAAVENRDRGGSRLYFPDASQLDRVQLHLGRVQLQAAGSSPVHRLRPQEDDKHDVHEQDQVQDAAEKLLDLDVARWLNGSMSDQSAGNMTGHWPESSTPTSNVTCEGLLLGGPGRSIGLELGLLATSPQYLVNCTASELAEADYIRTAMLHFRWAEVLPPPSALLNPPTPSPPLPLHSNRHTPFPLASGPPTRARPSLG